MEERKPKVGDKIRIIKSITSPNCEGCVAKITFIPTKYDWFDYKVKGKGSKTIFLDEPSNYKYEFIDEPETPTLDKLIVHCPEKYMYEKLVELVGISDNANDSGWERVKDESGFRINNGKIDLSHYINVFKNNPEFGRGCQILHYNEFMAKYFPEEKVFEPSNPEFIYGRSLADKLVGQPSTTYSNRISGESAFSEKVFSGAERMFSSRLSSPFNPDYWDRESKVLDNYKKNNKPKNKIMENIKCAANVVKHALRSEEDKLLIEYNAINEDGNWIEQGIKAILDLEAKDRGYKSYKSLGRKVGNDGANGVVGIFSMDDLIIKHKDTLVAQLKEDKKNNK